MTVTRSIILYDALANQTSPEYVCCVLCFFPWIYVSFFHQDPNYPAPAGEPKLTLDMPIHYCWFHNPTKNTIAIAGGVTGFRRRISSKIIMVNSSVLNLGIDRKSQDVQEFEC